MDELAQDVAASDSRHNPGHWLQNWITQCGAGCIGPRCDRHRLKPGGRLVLIEGYWNTGAGLHAQEIVEALPTALMNLAVQNLSDQPELWGGAVSDERYAVSADLQP